MTDKIWLSHTRDQNCVYNQEVSIPDGVELSGEGVVIYTNYDSSCHAIIPHEVFREFVRNCQRVLAQWDFP